MTSIGPVQVGIERLSAETLAFSESDRAKPFGTCKGVLGSRNFMFHWNKILRCIRTLSVPPLLELEANVHLQEIDSVLGSGVPVNLPISHQPILLVNSHKNCRRNEG